MSNSTPFVHLFTSNVKINKYVDQLAEPFLYIELAAWAINFNGETIRAEPFVYNFSVYSNTSGNTKWQNVVRGFKETKERKRDT